MLKVLVWVVSNDYRFLNGAIEILNRQDNGFEAINTIRGTSFADVDACAECDVLLVVGAKQIGMSRIVQVAKQLKLPEEKLLGDWIVCIPGFTLEKYRQLQRSRLSILSKSCFGGLISNTLGLPFLSPFVNLALSDRDFLKFIRAPYNYIKEEPHLKNVTYCPHVSLGDITIHMVHYKTVKEAMETWNERKKRINFDNLLVSMYTNSEEILAEFDALPYEKKVCFVPFSTDFESAFYLNQKLYDKPVRDPARITEFMTHDYARGNPFFYDPFDMLLYGKKTPLIDM